MKNKPNVNGMVVLESGDLDEIHGGILAAGRGVCNCNGNCPCPRTNCTIKCGGGIFNPASPVINPAPFRKVSR